MKLSLSSVRRLLLMMMICSLPLMAHPGRHRRYVPELDPGSMASAIALLAGGVMVLRDRSRRK